MNGLVEYLTVEEVIELQANLIKKYGGIHGIRDRNSLESALFAPKTTLFNQEMYPTIFDKAAAYLFHIISNHAFNDANKRTGYSVTLIFLETNRATINFNDDDFVDLILEVAKGKSSKEVIKLDDISEFLETGKCPALKYILRKNEILNRRIS